MINHNTYCLINIAALILIHKAYTLEVILKSVSRYEVTIVSPNSPRVYKLSKILINNRYET